MILLVRKDNCLSVTRSPYSGRGVEVRLESDPIALIVALSTRTRNGANNTAGIHHADLVVLRIAEEYTTCGVATPYTGRTIQLRSDGGPSVS